VRCLFFTEEKDKKEEGDMCGIVGYIGKKSAMNVILDALKRMEYRGYDSAGLCVGDTYVRVVGDTDVLRKKLSSLPHDSGDGIGIGHTRWATHGGKSECNAHPHTGTDGRIFVVHNGMIENYASLRTELEKTGVRFSSETDTEVIPQLIEWHVREGCSLEDAVHQTLGRLKGTYGLVIHDKESPDMLIAACMSSPVILGIGEGEYIVASDLMPIMRYTDKIVRLEDGDIATITSSGYMIQSNGRKVRRTVETPDIESAASEKGEYPHYLIKEIMECPDVLKNTLRGRVLPSLEDVKLGGLADYGDIIKKTKRIIIVGCGSALHAGYVAEYFLEEYARIPVEVQVASEFNDRSQPFDEGTLIIAVSQSGETADTLTAVREAKRKRLPVIGIVNVVGSAIARETDAGVYNHAGPEVSVASTKAFISQVVVFMLLTVLFGRQRHLSPTDAKEILSDLVSLHEKIETILSQWEEIVDVGKHHARYENALYIGKGLSAPVAVEGALKLKELSYIHAEGYPAGEMKHGPLALIDENFLSVCIVPQDSVRGKVLSAMEEIKAREGRIVAIATEGDKEVKRLADTVISISHTREMFHPILSSIVLQLFAYGATVERGYDVDRPRNLAKSVTV
jgi:glucosamine--fructose-6-phosphate aminotransferase (isomerizing)